MKFHCITCGKMKKLFEPARMGIHSDPHAQSVHLLGCIHNFNWIENIYEFYKTIFPFPENP